MLGSSRSKEQLLCSWSSFSGSEPVWFIVADGKPPGGLYRAVVLDHRFVAPSGGGAAEACCRRRFKRLGRACRSDGDRSQAPGFRDHAHRRVVLPGSS
jgi:hypothetical protein